MKWLLKIAVILIVLVVIVVGAAFFYVDSIAKGAIERGATYALGVNTTLGSADVGLLSGEFSMSGLDVDNPEGFVEAHFLRLGTGYVSVSLGATALPYSITNPDYTESASIDATDKAEGTLTAVYLDTEIGLFRGYRTRAADGILATDLLVRTGGAVGDVRIENGLMKMESVAPVFGAGLRVQAFHARRLVREVVEPDVNAFRERHDEAAGHRPVGRAGHGDRIEGINARSGAEEVAQGRVDLGTRVVVEEDTETRLAQSNVQIRRLQA